MTGKQTSWPVERQSQIALYFLEAEKNVPKRANQATFSGGMGLLPAHEQ